MAYRVLALLIAAGVSLSSVALARDHCRIGQIYFRSKHTCIAKGTAVARRIYHNGHQIAASTGESTTVHRPSRAAHAAAPAMAIPVPPVRFVRDGVASTPVLSQAVETTGSLASAVPEAAERPNSPYGVLAPLTPAN
jgi:hypothetical protein